MSKKVLTMEGYDTIEEVIRIVRKYGLSKFSVGSTIKMIRKYGLPNEDKSIIEWIEDTLEYDVSLVLDEIIEENMRNEN